MNKSKDKRIRKLGKKHIWPSILGLFVILLCFVAILVISTVALIGDMIKTKITETTNDIHDISNLFEQVDTMDELHEITSLLELYVDMETDIETIVVLGKDGEKIWSSSGQFPTFEYYEDDLGLIDEIRIFPKNDPGNTFIYENDTFFFNDEFLKSANQLSIWEEDNTISISTLALAQMKLWYEIPVKAGSVFILKDLKIYNYDLLALEVCTLLICILILIFSVYYLISFVALFINMHKTTKLLYTDIVTGGANELLFEKKGEKLLKSGQWHNRKYAIIHLRMRKYRSYCTCFGVKEGEILLEKCYCVLKKNVSSKELVAHFENAKFGLLLLYENEEQLMKRIEETETALNTISPNVKLYFAVGIYLVQKGDKEIGQLYNNALLACDKLGDESESKLAFFDIEINNQRIWERKVEDELDRAIANKEFLVYLQPKIRTSKEVLAGAEALVRWIHPQDGFIAPGKLIPILEKNGFITKLDDYMLEEVAVLQAKWIDEGRKIVPISVNISRAHFTRADLAEHICSIIDRYQVPHDVIELELTESAFFDDKKLLLSTIDKLRESGFHVSMDDFGSGYSSLNSLKEMHIDILKIDGGFFRGADVDERGKLIVSEVISLAKKLDMTIVAEGIENREQVDFLTAQECDMIQGYYFAKPMPADEFAAKYKED